MKQYDYLIVGANLYGAVFAYEAARRNKTCLVIDRSDCISGEYASDIEERLVGIDVQMHTDYSAFMQANPSIADKTIVADMMDMAADEATSMEEIIRAALAAVKEEFDPMI